MRDSRDYHGLLHNWSVAKKFKGVSVREEFPNSKGDILVLTDKGVEFLCGEYCYYISYKSIVGFYLYNPDLKGDFIGMDNAVGTINIITSSEFKIKIEVERTNILDYFSKVNKILKEKIE